jgi:hypothetical protein
MQATTEIKVTPDEWDLMVELLEREGEDLPAEIHHTRSREYRTALHRRLDQVNSLLRELKLAAEKGRENTSVA